MMQYYEEPEYTNKHNYMYVMQARRKNPQIRKKHVYKFVARFRWLIIFLENKIKIALKQEE